MKTWILLFLTSISSLLAEEKKQDEPKVEHIRVVKEAEQELLQTAVVSLQKDQVHLDLIGAVHIADKSYYQALNKKFQSYDRLLFEMVGGESLGSKAEAAKQTTEVKKKDQQNNLSSLREIYALAAKTLALTGQAEVIDYHAKNFVHADLTYAEFSAKQKARHESFLSLMLKAQMKALFAPPNVKQPDAARLLHGYLANDADMMKAEFIDTLGAADDQLGMFTGETVILTDRNTYCLKVLEQEVMKGYKKLAIFYGAAHLAGMEKSLLENGWQVTQRDWLTAWKVKKKAFRTPPKTTPCE